MRHFTGSVRVCLYTSFAAALLLSGCAGHRSGAPTFSQIPASSRPSISLPDDRVIMTPENVLIGKIAKVNQSGRFVVMTFPIGHLPVQNQRLSTYRRGLKVGEIRVTGPQLDDSVVGDIAVGEAQPGDEVRAE
jgi:hypothetical protein